MTRTDTHVTAICPHMPHTLAASPCPVKHPSPSRRVLLVRLHTMPRFPVCIARICHDLPKDDPRYLRGAAWLLEASRGSQSTLALPGLAPLALQVALLTVPLRDAS